MASAKRGSIYDHANFIIYLQRGIESVIIRLSEYLLFIRCIPTFVNIGWEISVDTSLAPLSLQVLDAPIRVPQLSA